MSELTLEDIGREAEALMKDVPEGEPLDALSEALVRLGLAVAVTSLDRDAIDSSIGGAFDAGASPAQVQEVIALVSGLGVHSLMMSAVSVLEAARTRGLIETDDRLTEVEAAFWNLHVGDDPFWIGFEAEAPGFLHALLKLSPDLFSGFFAYCAIPWKSGTVRARTKELIAMAVDATPTHRFLPGFRVHLQNALSLGAGRVAVKEVLALAAAAPLHQGTH
jgi:alkylhydroperoxidase/carboxymuconolactone decarboxylase family protein YurZ